MSRPLAARLNDMRLPCRCGHDRGSHYFGGECQQVCGCRQWGPPLDREDAPLLAEGGYLHLGDVHAGLSLYHCVRCAAIVEKTARVGHHAWHADIETPLYDR